MQFHTPLRPEDPRRLGPYELLGRLGEGGMGVVYLGRDDRGEAAIKIIKRQYADSRQAKRRLRRELDAALRVPRYCTARIYRYDLDNDPPYIVSEYIDGPTLNEVVTTEGPLDDSKLYSLAIAVAGALKEIHLAGVIHGDLTPRNVMLSLHGPRVIDFGIARGPERTVSSSIEIAGTPSYMTPEHFSSGQVTTAADVFAWGSVMAFAGTGRPPFGEGSLAELRNRIRHEHPDLVGLDPVVRPLVEAALQKRPEDRPDADWLLEELKRSSRAAHGGLSTTREVEMVLATATLGVDRSSGPTDANRPPDEQAERRCDFYVSYTGMDAAWAEWIAWQLKNAGYTVTIQAWHFRPGMNFVALMQQALDTCQRVIAIVSRPYLDQLTYGSDEWNAAFTDGELSVVLVKVDPVRLPRLLRPWVHIDLTGLDAENAAARLLEGVAPGLAKPTEVPASPGRVATGTVEGPRFPGQYVGISNLPARNVAFSGRDDLLVELHHGFQQRPPAVAPAQTLYGLGGVGKTQLALEYAYRYQSDYDLIWWIAAYAPDAVAAALAELGARLGLIDVGVVIDQEQLAAAVLAELRRRQRWLLIFDNADDPRQLAPYLPQGNGAVLITSQQPIWGGTARPVKIGTFTRADSIAFLTQRTGSNDEAMADSLAEELGDLPLALEQAGSYLEQAGTPLAEYLTLLRRRRHEVLRLGEPSAYQHTVDTTWIMAIERVATVQPAGQAGVALLRLCSFLAPEPIPLDLITSHPDLSGDMDLSAAARDELTLQDAEVVRRLKDLGATPADVGQGDVPWTVMADPEGNEFCVLDSLYRDTGPIASVVVDCADPRAMARFWDKAMDWTLHEVTDHHAVLRSAKGVGPYLQFLPTPDVKTVWNRVHLDIRPYPGDDLEAEAARLQTLGATAIDLGQSVPWTVLADPEGNEFCLLAPG